jgi:AmiR/NasT family two-component response regulator
MTSMMDEFEAPWAELYTAGLIEPAEVHQAAGMLASRLGVSAQDALARLRGWAALIDQPLDEVADAVVTRRSPFGL